MPPIFYGTPSLYGILTSFLPTVSEFYISSNLSLISSQGLFWALHSTFLFPFPQVTFTKDETIGFWDATSVADTAK